MTPLFESFLESVIFWGTLALYYVAILTWMARTHARQGKKKPDLLPLVMLAFPIGIAIGYARIGVLPHWLFFPGEVAFVVGTGFTLWSYSILGQYVSPYVLALPEHKIIQAGPYRYIRHPGYLGQIVAHVGLGLALQSWVAVVIMLAMMAGFAVYRIRNEEAFLGSELGDSYLSYMRTTKRFVPFVF